jgi:hypothetical protein
MAKRTGVYTITVMSAKPFTKGFRIREWGYYFKRADAAQVIEHNLTDISELDYYHFAVLSFTGEGPLAIPESLQWYEFEWANSSEGVMRFIQAKKIDRPEQFKHICA